MKNNEDDLFFSVRSIIIRSMDRAYHAVNAILVQTYWHIGKVIVEEEQQGKIKAKYGNTVLKNLARQLGEEFGKGYDYTNLTNMRKFYLAFPILDALRQELSWTHYRLLSRLDTEEKKNFYLTESIANNWNSRTLQRQINSLSFERLLKYQEKNPSDENIHNLIKDPYIFEFLGLPFDTKNTERDIETAIINHIQQFLLEFGKGFAFVARQQHIVTDTSDFFIDLIF